MISLRDVPVLVGLAGTVFSGGVAYHDLKVTIAEVSRDYRQHVATTQKKDLYDQKFMLERVLKQDPENDEARKQLEIVNQLLEENMEMQKQLQKERK